jgi:hypothetical protein
MPDATAAVTPAPAVTSRTKDRRDDGDDEAVDIDMEKA